MPETKPAWLLRRQAHAPGAAVLAQYLIALVALHIVLGFVFTPKLVTMAAISAVAFWGFSRVMTPTVRTVAEFAGASLLFVLILPPIVWLTNVILGWPSPRVHWEMITVSGFAHYAGYAVLGMAAVVYHDPELRSALREWVCRGHRAVDPARAAVGVAALVCACVGLSLGLTGGSFHFARSFDTVLTREVSRQYGYRVTGCETGEKVAESRFIECKGGITAVLGPDMRVTIDD